MDEGRRREIRANWERALESLDAAQDLLEGGHPDFAASRAYYAAFYGATALLLMRDIKYAKHTGVISAIHRDFVKPGILSVPTGKALDKLYEIRNVGDYGEVQHVPEAVAQETVTLARGFLDEVLRVMRDSGFDPEERDTP